MAARRQGPGRSSTAKTPRRGKTLGRGRSTASSPRSPRLPSTLQLVTPTGAIDVAWPKPERIASRSCSGGPSAGLMSCATARVGSEPSHWPGSRTTTRASSWGSWEFDDAQREQLAHAGTIRVSVPYTEEQEGWEARILPWEFVLSAGTRDLRTGPLVVTRSLLQPRPTRAPRRLPQGAVRRELARAPRAGLGLQGRTTTRQAVRGEGRRSVPATRLPHSRGARGCRQEVPPRHRASRRLRHRTRGSSCSRSRGAEEAPDGYLLAGAGGVEPVAALDLAARDHAWTASLRRSCSATSGTPRRGSPRC